MTHLRSSAHGSVDAKISPGQKLVTGGYFSNAVFPLKKVTLAERQMPDYPFSAVR